MARPVSMLYKSKWDFTAGDSISEKLNLSVSSISSSTVLAAHFQPLHPILPW